MSVYMYASYSGYHGFSLSNSAEELFESMEEKNGGTYDALMLGLFKVFIINMKNMFTVLNQHSTNHMIECSNFISP